MKLLVLLTALGAAPPLLAIEIATGRMLGADYDPGAFYLREAGKPWRKTYTGPGFRPEAAGRLMNLRIGQAIVHDEWLTEEQFDPAANTSRVIAALDAWKAHGVLAISTSLQGANPAYELTTNIRRARAYSLGPGKGMLMSAFRPDGSLKPEWMNRALRLARALDRRGMALHLMIYYQHQDEVLRDPAALRQGVRNVADWVIDHQLRNVILELANQIDSDAYDHDRYLAASAGSLIELIRRRFTERKAGFCPPISTSTQGGPGMLVPPAILEHADLILLHGNHRQPEEKGQRTAQLRRESRWPVVFSEDNNGRETDAATLAKELASLDAIFRAGGSWGYMPWRAAQVFPFRIYDPFAATGQDADYFRRVLQAIQRLTLAPRGSRQTKQ